MPWKLFPHLRDVPIPTGADVTCPQGWPHPEHCDGRAGETGTGQASGTVETKNRAGRVKGREENPEILRKKHRKGKPRASGVWLPFVNEQEQREETVSFCLKMQHSSRAGDTSAQAAPPVMFPLFSSHFQGTR